MRDVFKFFWTVLSISSVSLVAGWAVGITIANMFGSEALFVFVTQNIAAFPAFGLVIALALKSQEDAQ
ncbi:hypothetical protein [Rhizobium laguerreae]|uniref:hypothetical protein n=1 Tax=Rhizobium laguerreae TaxID=1076926 RepID=UPI001C914383|nr:hypothetical protein [Rhizobium laguerreae]MBY3434801.1 hypothetical protein [Rhizobium laguerreae]MBY3448944.1 hypothetical protein [Rhizobium laguerreae]MBY3456718.1 hypothetical protein [Rhizobium laguerreae]